MPEIPRDIRFDHGIELIINSNHAIPASLPDSRKFVPGDARVQDRLSEILSPLTIEQSTLESFRPEIRDTTLLTLAGFRGAHAQCQVDVEEKLQTLPDSDDRNKVARLQQFLVEKQHLTDLLSQLRQLLQQA